MKGLEGKMLWIIVIAITTALVIAIVILFSGKFLPGFIRGIQNVFCKLPFLSCGTYGGSQGWGGGGAIRGTGGVSIEMMAYFALIFSALVWILQNRFWSKKFNPTM